MMSAYFGKQCPNGCLEKFLEEVRSKNYIDGHEPKLFWTYQMGYEMVSIYRWSKKLKRYPERTSGNYARLSFKYCPHCGAKLIDEGR